MVICRICGPLRKLSRKDFGFKRQNFSASERSVHSESQELIKLEKFCNDLANPKSSEMAFLGEPFWTKTHPSLAR